MLMTLVRPVEYTVVRLPYFSGDSRPDVVGTCGVGESAMLADGTVGAVRIEDFFTEAAANALHAFVSTGVVFERDDIGETKRASRASRTGELPDDPIRTTSDGSHGEAEDALAIFGSDWFIENLSRWIGVPLRVLRPSTPYRLVAGDYIDPHDDYPAPEYRLSVACNLTPNSDSNEGGETYVGLVDAVEEYDGDDFFPLKRWRLKSGESTLQPVFNSLLLLPLSSAHAHAVRRVASGSRYSITTLYGDAVVKE
jgi:hypothetical protein